jgi:hypothetical protein
MKNLAKPLEWDFNSFIHIHETQLSAFGCYYFIHEYDGDSIATLADRNGHVIADIGEYNMLDEAKAACQQHYAESLWDNLSEEARAILEQHFEK